MIDERTILLLEDMLSYARDAVEFGENVDAPALDADKMRLYAIVRALEVIGEAASKIDPAWCAQNPQIPWRRIIDFRNVIVHGYDRIRTSILVETIHDHVPPLIAELERILSESPNQGPNEGTSNP